MDRILKAHSPLGEDQLLFRSMHGTEGLSQLFEFDVDLLSPQPSIDADAVLGKPLALEIKTAAGVRFLHGQITRFAPVGFEDGVSRHTIYRATMRPWLWFLTRASDNRTFLNKSVVEILEEVFGAYGFVFEKKLCGTYRPWEYCAQYDESDFAFVSRLMELEGIYYFFEHEKERHTLVLADDAGAHEPMPGYESIDCFAADRPITEDMEVIDDWQVTEELRSGSYTVDDFNFTTPKGDLSSTRNQPRSHDNAGYDMYEWLGEHTDGGQAEHYARVRLEEAQSLAARSNGHATVRGMAPGRKFTLRNAPRGDDNRDYLIVSVSYALREGGYATGSAPGSYGFGFVAQPADNPFRAPRQTPMPRTTGPQTATVVGPEGEEIWTDSYGRVKLQFHWDRAGQRNENSSAWVRVSQAWAGEGYGTVHVPRIGQEVVVDFIAGRIDRPIVMGRVYNADQMPPFDLPGEATKSGIASRSTRGGSPANANAIVFEDSMGAEQILLHAERNLDTEVEGDETHTTNKDAHDADQGPRVVDLRVGRGAAYHGRSGGDHQRRRRPHGDGRRDRDRERRSPRDHQRNRAAARELRGHPRHRQRPVGNYQCGGHHAGAGAEAEDRARAEDGLRAQHAQHQHRLHDQDHDVQDQRDRHRDQRAGAAYQCHRPGLVQPAGARVLLASAPDRRRQPGYLRQQDPDDGLQLPSADGRVPESVGGQLGSGPQVGQKGALGEGLVGDGCVAHRRQEEDDQRHGKQHLNGRFARTKDFGWIGRKSLLPS